MSGGSPVLDPSVYIGSSTTLPYLSIQYIGSIPWQHHSGSMKKRNGPIEKTTRRSQVFHSTTALSFIAELYFCMAVSIPAMQLVT